MFLQSPRFSFKVMNCQVTPLSRVWWMKRQVYTIWSWIYNGRVPSVLGTSPQAPLLTITSLIEYLPLKNSPSLAQKHQPCISLLHLWHCLRLRPMQSILSRRTMMAGLRSTSESCTNLSPVGDMMFSFLLLQRTKVVLVRKRSTPASQTWKLIPNVKRFSNFYSDPSYWSLWIRFLPKW